MDFTCMTCKGGGGIFSGTIHTQRILGTPLMATDPVPDSTARERPGDRPYAVLFVPRVHRESGVISVS